MNIFVHGQNLQDKQTILQKCIDLPALQNFFHVDKLPERVPLIIYFADYKAHDIKLTKFNTAVKIITDKDSLKTKAYLDIKKFEITNNKADVLLNYSIEGIQVQITLTKINDNWTLQTSKLTEK